MGAGTCHLSGSAIDRVVLLEFKTFRTEVFGVWVFVSLHFSGDSEDVGWGWL